MSEGSLENRNDARRLRFHSVAFDRVVVSDLLRLGAQDAVYAAALSKVKALLFEQDVTLLRRDEKEVDQVLQNIVQQKYNPLAQNMFDHLCTLGYAVVGITRVVDPRALSETPGGSAGAREAGSGAREAGSGAREAGYIEYPVLMDPEYIEVTQTIFEDGRKAFRARDVRFSSRHDDFNPNLIVVTVPGECPDASGSFFNSRAAKVRKSSAFIEEIKSDFCVANAHLSNPHAVIERVGEREAQIAGGMGSNGMPADSIQDLGLVGDTLDLGDIVHERTTASVEAAMRQQAASAEEAGEGARLAGVGTDFPRLISQNLAGGRFVVLKEGTKMGTAPPQAQAPKDLPLLLLDHKEHVYCVLGLRTTPERSKGRNDVSTMGDDSDVDGKVLNGTLQYWRGVLETALLNIFTFIYSRDNYVQERLRLAEEMRFRERVAYTLLQLDELGAAADAAEARKLPGVPPSVLKLKWPTSDAIGRIAPAPAPEAEEEQEEAGSQAGGAAGGWESPRRRGRSRKRKEKEEDETGWEMLASALPKPPEEESAKRGANDPRDGERQRMITMYRLQLFGQDIDVRSLWTSPTEFYFSVKPPSVCPFETLLALQGLQLLKHNALVEELSRTLKIPKESFVDEKELRKRQENAALMSERVKGAAKEFAPGGGGGAKKN